MRAVALRSSLVLPAFAWALTGAWPHATQTEALDTATVERHFDMDAAAQEILDATSLQRAPSLSVALFSGEAEALVPMQLEIQVVDLEAEEAVMVRSVVAGDGQSLAFDQVVPTNEGERIFRVQTTPRMHIGDRIELDWELEVHEADFAGLDWESYLLHRFNLGPRPGVDAPQLRVARADIVEIGAEAYEARFELEGRAFLLRMGARPAAG